MPEAERSLLRTLAVARYLGVTHQRVTQMVAEGKLPPPRRDHLGPSWTATAIERWAKREWWGTKPWRVKD
jgi:predicted DNA-binding transcriptional regulator AlpA